LINQKNNITTPNQNQSDENVITLGFGRQGAGCTEILKSILDFAILSAVDTHQ
jgi:hypothetical protein